MIRGRHRGRSHWGILPPIGRSFAYLPQDIEVIAVRCFAIALFTFGAMGVMLITGQSESVATWVTTSFSMAATTLLGVGLQLARYSKLVLQHVKAQQAAEWLRVVQEHRVEYLQRREDFLANSISELREQFKEEKVALQEIREDRIAEERMVGFLRGLKESSSMKAYHANPRNRLRVVHDADEESA